MPGRNTGRLWLMAGLVWTLAAPAVPAGRKIYLFLEEPLQNESVVVQLEGAPKQPSTTDFPTEQVDQLISNEIEIVYKHGTNAKPQIALTLQDRGLIKLEAFDFYGKSLGVLVHSTLSAGIFTFEESETWKQFSRFHGIGFFTMTVNGQIAAKQIFAKVE